MIQHKTFFSFSPLQWNAYNFLNFLSRVNCCNASKHHWLIRCIHNILHSAENHRGVMKLLYHARILLLLLFFSYLGQLIEYVINRWMQRFNFLHAVINIPRRVSFIKRPHQQQCCCGSRCRWWWVFPMPNLSYEAYNPYSTINVDMVFIRWELLCVWPWAIASSIQQCKCVW